MEDDSLIKRYESFLKLNHLEISKESAEDFTDMQENITPLMLSMEYVNKGVLLKSLISRKKYFNNALIIEPNNFAAKICNLELTSFSLDESRILSPDFTITSFGLSNNDTVFNSSIKLYKLSLSKSYVIISGLSIFLAILSTFSCTNE